MSEFTAALERETGRRFDNHEALHAYCAAKYARFWEFFVRWCPDLGFSGTPEPPCVGRDCETAVFFPGLQLNYADSLLNLAVAPADAPAITACHAEGPGLRLTRGELRHRVAACAHALQRLGVGPGDRVAAVMRNDAHAVIAALAVTAVGATLSTASPDMGVQAMLDRFEPLQPRVFIAHQLPQPMETGLALGDKVQSLLQELPSARLLVRLDGEPLALHPATMQRSLDELIEAGDAQGFHWPRFGFNHPLFIMFSSGTTGKPKCIVHGAGGTLIEHAKEHRLHSGLGPGDRLYFHTSCSWMMWNWQLSALASGVELVTYDGPISTVDRLWRLAAEHRVTVFGTSPGYLKMSQEAGLAPARELDLGSLRAILSTGAVLYDSQFDWVRRHVKDVPLQSISGGTDIIGCFVLGHPDLPVRSGEAQCRSLGLDVQSWVDGEHAAGRVGQLVCTNPFPSRPLGFFGDVGGGRFHQAYFAENPGAWTHGDLIEISAQGGARLHGRSDGLLNVRGVKLAPGEIYRAIADVPEIRDAMLVQSRAMAHEEPRTVAMLVLADGIVLDKAFTARLRRHIAERLSAAHVPDRIIDVPELPVTHNGKPSEAAARAAVNGEPVNNEASLRNPGCLRAMREHPGLRVAEALVLDGADLDGQLHGLWQRVLGIEDIAPDDNFFDLGGNSLLGTRLLAEVELLTRCALPLAVLFQAPTFAAMGDLLRAGGVRPGTPMMVPLRPGAGAPVFLVHGLSGTVMECWALIKALRTPRPLWGLQAQGLEGTQAPHDKVQDMAKSYVAALRAVQPAGPYAICGFSFGGLVAFEMAQQLRRRGEAVESLCLLDPQVNQDLPWALRIGYRCGNAIRALSSMPRSEMAGYLVDRLRDAARGTDSSLPAHQSLLPAGVRLPAAQQRVRDALWTALAAYRPAAYDGPVLLVRPEQPLAGYIDPLPVWKKAVGRRLQVVRVPGEHLELVSRSAQRVAALFDGMLR